MQRLKVIKLGFLGGGADSIAGKVHLIASEMDRKFKVIGGIFSKDREKSKKALIFIMLSILIV